MKANINEKWITLTQGKTTKKFKNNDDSKMLVDRLINNGQLRLKDIKFEGKKLSKVI